MARLGIGVEYSQELLSLPPHTTNPPTMSDDDKYRAVRDSLLRFGTTHYFVPTKSPEKVLQRFQLMLNRFGGVFAPIPPSAAGKVLAGVYMPGQFCVFRVGAVRASETSCALTLERRRGSSAVFALVFKAACAYLSHPVASWDTAAHLPTTLQPSVSAFRAPAAVYAPLPLDAMSPVLRMLASAYYDVVIEGILCLSQIPKLHDEVLPAVVPTLVANLVGFPAVPDAAIMAAMTLCRAVHTDSGAKVVAAALKEAHYAALDPGTATVEQAALRPYLLTLNALTAPKPE